MSLIPEEFLLRSKNLIVDQPENPYDDDPDTIYDVVALNNAEQEGKFAHQNGVTIAYNPYDKETRRYEAWEKGWMT